MSQCIRLNSKKNSFRGNYSFLCANRFFFLSALRSLMKTTIFTRMKMIYLKDWNWRPVLLQCIKTQWEIWPIIPSFFFLYGAWLFRPWLALFLLICTYANKKILSYFVVNIFHKTRAAKVLITCQFNDKILKDHFLVPVKVGD